MPGIVNPVRDLQYNKMKGNNLQNDFTKKPLSEVEDEMVSVILVVYREQYIGQTIANMQQMSEGPVEFIVFQDGDYRDFSVAGAMVTVVTSETNIGRRPASDKAVEYAKGKYVFHIDAHCATGVKGWDTIYKQLCLDNRTMVIPDLQSLSVPEFKIKKHCQGHKYIDKRYKDQWSGIKCKGQNQYTITGNGMGWFMEKQFYQAFGGCDPKQPDRWGNFGVEWASKVWLSDPYKEGVGGKVILCGEAPFAHMWKNKGTGYKTPGVSRGRKELFKWVRNEGENQCRQFDFFETEFPHLFPSKIKRDCKQPMFIHREPLPIVGVDKPAVTAIMNTNGLYPDLDAEAIQSFIKQDYGNKQLIIVSTNQTYKLDQDYKNITVINIEPFERFPQQIAFAIKQVKTPLWCVMDSDDVFACNHISSLVKLYRDAVTHKDLESPGYIINDTAWEQHKANWPKLRHRGWWCCLFDKVDDKFVDDNFNKFLAKSNKDTGSDLHFIKDKAWHWEKYHKEEPTVLHRLGIGFHIRKEGWKKGYYQRSLEAVKNNTMKPIKPNWRKDYNKMINEFNGPEITYIMGTFQRNNAETELAINSFLANKYENKTLLITNSNEKPLWLSGFHPRVKVIDIEPTNRVEEIKEALKHVETDFVSFIDDDDEVANIHIAQMVEALRNHKFKSVINENFTELDTKTGKIKAHKKLMWWNGIYRMQDVKKYDLGTDMQGFDKRFMEAMKPIKLDLPPTYIWKRNAVIHVSKYKHNTHAEKQARIDKARAAAVHVNPIRLDYPLENTPYVTVCMATYGAHKQHTEEAIMSFLDQTYQNKQLLLFNTHKDPIEFDREYPEITVCEMHGANYPTLAEKHLDMIKYVHTPLWCIIDDDDLILPDHLKTLIQIHNWNKESYAYKKRNRRLMLSKHKRKIIMNGDEFDHIKQGGGWTCGIYDKVSDKALEKKFRTPHPKYSDACYDVRLHKDAVWQWHRKEVSYPTLPTYIWRGGGDTFHVSSIGTNPEMNNAVFHDGNARANAIDIAEKFAPHLKRDYGKQFIDFLNSKTLAFLKGSRKQYIHLGMRGTMRKVEHDFLCDFMTEHGVKDLIEFGCGASTLAFVGKGFNIKSYETKEHWRDRTRLMLDRDCIELYDGNYIEIGFGHDMVLIDGPDPPPTRENSYISAANARPKFIACHDIFRDEEKSFIKEYLLGGGYAECRVLDPAKRKGRRKFMGVGIYERID